MEKNTIGGLVRPWQQIELLRAVGEQLAENLKHLDAIEFDLDYAHFEGEEFEQKRTRAEVALRVRETLRELLDDTSVHKIISEAEKRQEQLSSLEWESERAYLSNPQACGR